MTIDASSDLAAIPGVVANLRHTFTSERTRPIEWRTRQLDGLLRVLDEGEDTIVAALADDFGKPSIEAWIADIAATRTEVADVRKHMAKWAKPRKAKLRLQERPGKAWLQPEPLGVALVIAPWNYPVNLLVAPMASAFAAGNCVVAKPSELTPNTSRVLSALLRANLDPEAFAVFEGGVDVSTALLEQRWDHIFFTGSTAVGKIVAKAAAEHLTPVTLELGGKSPVIVTADADLDVAARRIMFGKRFNAGQTCIAPDYVLVERSVRDDLVDKLVATIADFDGGDGEYAKIVNDRHVARIAELLENHNGSIATGGELQLAERTLSPTVVVDPDPDASVMQEEIFGPILPVLSVDDLEEAIAFVNGRPKPLALYVFTENADEADRVLAATSSGGAVVNHTIMHFATTALPFGGVGDSGMGSYHTRNGFDTFSHLKPVLSKSTSPDPSFQYPPYTKIKKAIFKKVL